MDQRAELSEFLRSRRGRLRPADVGLPELGRRRRVPGLRREELAQLAGVSVAYYTRLEQGNSGNVSAEVLDSIARALRLSEAEHSHLSHLARPKPKKYGRTVRSQRLRPALQQLMDSMESVPSYVLGRRLDILGWNRMARVLLGDFAAMEPHERNMARMVFLDPRAAEIYVDRERKAVDVVSLLRMYAGYCPDDAKLSALVGELSVRSAEFRGLWAAHTVQEKGHGSKLIRHPLVGEMTLFYEALRPPEDPELTLVTYHAEPGSRSAESLRLLAGWGPAEPPEPGSGPRSGAPDRTGAGGAATA
ncbi:helix-turn-helix transcriptional regulator [Streptomyces sp. CAU 1734]|uniref:helix-turn-helix domain-containing protein n=1 Tax=Streptomyces sp. CAU 1734 TaxID=3140360 RepID=UPI00325FE54D